MTVWEQFDDAELARAFGSATFERGREYAEQGRVLEVEVQAPPGAITLVNGVVQGSISTPYRPNLTLVDDPGGAWMDARCSCPVVRLCKHAAAVMLVARADQDLTPAAVEWERRLAAVLDELDDAAAATTTRRPLALQVELPSAGGVRRRTWGRNWGEPVPEPRGALRVRPLARSPREAWVKTGAGWSDLTSLTWQGSHDPDQVTVLSELLAAHRAANRQAYYSADSHLTLGTFGPSLWPLLEAAERAGIVLVPAGRLAAVRVVPTPVELRLDVNGADDDAAAAQVRLGVLYDGEWYSGADLEIVGGSGHGVCLWRRRDPDKATAGDTWEVTLARLAKAAGPQTRRMVAAAQTLAVPHQDVGDLVAEYLPRVQRHLPVMSSDASVRVPDAVLPRLALTVTWKAVDEVHLAWTWRYRVGEDDRVYRLGETRGLRGLRRPDAEQAILDGLELSEEQQHRLFQARRRTHGPVPEQTFRGMLAVAFTEDTLVPLERSGQVEIEEVGSRPRYQEATEAPVIRFAARGTSAGGPAGEREDGGLRETHTDWLDLEVVITIGKKSVGLATLLEALTLGQERLILRDGTHLRIDRPEFAQLTELVRAARELEDQPREGVRLHKSDLGLWDELDDIGIVDAQASQWVRAAQALRGLTGLPEVEPTGVTATLRAYQSEGFRWLAFLWQARLGGILADDMGLGKTLQTLALVAHARATRPDDGPFLVVAPTSVVSTWAAEAAQFVPGLTVRAVTESRARRGTALAEVHAGADVVVTSYTLYRLEADAYVDLTWGGLVLDEAQTVKNHTGKTYQSIRRLDVPFRLALSGTPMENRLMELWSLLSIVAPGLYPHPQRFAETVAHPVEREGDLDALARFRRRIRPFLLRRTKDLVAADLPPKQEQVLEVQLTPKHRKVYDLHLQRERQNVLGLLGDFDRKRIAIFRSLTRLRQLSLDAGLVDPEYDGVGSAKLDVLVDHLHELVAEGHRALVFSQFTSFLTRARRRLDAEGIASTYLDGRTRKRAEVIADFKGGDAAVFLISLKAGGVGLTLTEADYVFVLDPWWNPAVEAQAVDRAHRIGQDRPVIVYRLVAADTIEEKVMELKARKAALFARVIEGDGGAGTPIDADDIRALFES